MRGLSSVMILSLSCVLVAGCEGDADTATPEAGAELVLEGGQSGIVPPGPEVTHASIAPEMEGLLAYYALDGDAVDGGPSALDGVVLGATPVMDRFGIAEGALSFQTLDDHVTFDAPIVGMNLTSLSVSLWFQSSMTDRGVMFHEGKKQGPGFQLRMLPGKDVIMARCGGAFTLESEGAYNDGSWHHIVVTGDGLGAVMWIDGVVVATHEGVYEQPEPMPYLPALGRDGGSDATDPKDGFVGALDDVSVFNRPMSAEEVAQLFEEGPPRPPVADVGPNISRFGLQIGVDGSRSYDPDGEIVSYLWDFGDGSAAVEGVTTSHAYTEFGVYTVTLIVTDDEGAQAYATLSASVRDPECVTPNCNQVDTWDPAWSQLEMEMLDEVNRNRIAGAICGGDPYPAVPPLEMNEIARVAARLHSLDMSEQNFFEHDNLDGLDPFDRMENAGYQGADPWGENIQAGSSTAVDAVASLMDSPGHCRNIMDPDYTVIGLGYAYGGTSDYGHYWTQCFGGGH
jgi:uncharacterized protein YkwD